MDAENGECLDAEIAALQDTRDTLKEGMKNSCKSSRQRWKYSTKPHGLLREIYKNCSKPYTL